MAISKEDFLEFISLVQEADKKEKDINEGLEKIFSDTGQYPPFIVSKFWTPLCRAFDLLMGIERDSNVGSELEWWICEEDPSYYDADGTKHSVKDPSDFYDFLINIRRAK